MKPMWVVLLLVKGGNPDTMKLKININVVLFQTRALLMAFLPSTNFKFIFVVAKSLFYWITDLRHIQCNAIYWSICCLFGYELNFLKLL